MSAKRSSEPSPVAFWFLCRHGQRNSPPAGGEIPLRITNPIRILPPHPPPLGAPSPRGEGFGGRSPPHPSRLRRATFPPRGRLLRGAPSSAPFGGTCPYPLCRYATSSLPLLAYGHFPLTGGIGPLTRGVGPQGEGFGGEGPSSVPGGRLEKCGGGIPLRKN